MTDLVSLLFITLIPIDCKITIFYLYLFTKEVRIHKSLELCMGKYSSISNLSQAY